MVSNFSYLNRYRHKVRNLTEIQKIIGNFPRERTVVLCHGVFDVVHPGHLRHLAFAKSKADILIVSVTADRHIRKGNYRPAIPQELRCLNLAALELVDYVCIDEEPTALSVITALRPDIYAKGFEYSSTSLGSATQEESLLLQEYGGLFLFTPGDYVLSSSNIITSAEPQVSIEKLLLMLDSFDINFETLREAVAALKNIRVHLIGDTIVDSHTYGSMIGGQTKTPTISLKYEGKKQYLGGAGVVARHLQAAGAEVSFTSVVGDDELANFVNQELKVRNLNSDLIVDTSRPTTEKNAILCQNYRLLKLDTVDNSPISHSIVERISKRIESVKTDVVIFSDFRHGIFNRQSIPLLLSSIPNGALKVADSQVASRWGNILDFQGFDLITPNEREARFALADQDSTIGPLAGKLFKESKSKNVILKLGERGLISLRDKSDGIHLSTLDSFTRMPVDAVGAGDALISYASLALKLTNSLEIASILGGVAAACACEKNGNNPVAVHDVLTKLEEVERLVSYRLS